jgi:hypothetical protein
MSTGNLTGKLVSRDFWPSCATCTLFAACATRPHHLAYPHAWHWGRECVSFPDGDLILTSWVGNTVIGQRHTGCTQYTVAPEYVSNLHSHHQRYLVLEHERTALEKTLARLERNGTFTSETESLYQQLFGRFLAITSEQRTLRQNTDAEDCAA